jgi:hypothetical protein
VGGEYGARGCVFSGGDGKESEYGARGCVFSGGDGKESELKSPVRGVHRRIHRFGGFVKRSLFSNSIPHNIHIMRLYLDV